MNKKIIRVFVFLLCVLHANDVFPQNVPCELTYAVTSSQLNVRAHPSNKSEIKHILDKDAQGCILSSQKKWVKIKQGWINKRFIRETKNNNEIRIQEDKKQGTSGAEAFMTIVVIIGMIFMASIGILRGIVTSFKDRYHLNILAYFVIVILFLLFMFTESDGSIMILYIFIAFLALWLLSVRINVLPVCGNCGSTRLIKTDQVLTDIHPKETTEGKKYLLKEYNSEYFCKKCGEYSNYTETAKEDM